MYSLSAVSACFTTSNLRVGRAQVAPNGARQLLNVFGRRQQQQQEDDAMKAKRSIKPDNCSSKRIFLLSLLGTAPLLLSDSLSVAETPQFRELEGSPGLKALDIREGSGKVPQPGDKVAVHYYARLAAKQGWRFDSTYDHKDSTGAPEPYVFVVGSGTVIKGLDMAVQTMKEGGVRRVIIPPSQGYQNTMQGPIPPNVFDRQRLYTTIFNPTRLANGEGSTLGTLIFDIELLKIRPN